MVSSGVRIPKVRENGQMHLYKVAEKNRGKKGDDPLKLLRFKGLHLFLSPIMERKTRFELATLALARRCSTTEPLPLKHNGATHIP